MNTLSLTKLVLIVSSGRPANIIAIKWKNRYRYLPDAFVVEGPKAGGHLGFNKDVFCGANASKVNSFSTVPELFQKLISGYHVEKQKFK